MLKADPYFIPEAPEPTALALLGIGALGLLCVRWVKRR
jgi:PEP-CTERM motif-containing protein